MPIYVPTDGIGSAYYGTDALARIYYGTDLVWQNGGPAYEGVNTPFFHGRSGYTADTGSVFIVGADGWRQPDDIALLFVDTANEALPSTLTTAGWTSAYTPTGTGTGAAAGSTRLYVFWARIDSSSNYPTSTTGDSGNRNGCTVIFVRGCTRTGNPIEAIASSLESSAATGMTFPGVTTSDVNRMIVNVASIGAPDATQTGNVSGWTNSDLFSVEEASDFANAAGVGGGIVAAYGIKQEAGAVTGTTATLANAAKQERVTLALIPEGNAPWLGAQNTGTGPGSIPADRICLLRVIPAVDMTIGSISFKSSSAAATSKQRAVVYSDSAGVPGTLLGSSSAENTGTAATTDYTLALSSPVTMTAGDPYWIGFHVGVASLSIRIASSNTSSTALALHSNSDTYSDGPASSYVGGATATGPMIIWTNPVP